MIEITETLESLDKKSIDTIVKKFDNGFRDFERILKTENFRSILSQAPSFLPESLAAELGFKYIKESKVASELYSPEDIVDITFDKSIELTQYISDEALRTIMFTSNKDDIDPKVFEKLIYRAAVKDRGTSYVKKGTTLYSTSGFLNELYESLLYFSKAIPGQKPPLKFKRVLIRIRPDPDMQKFIEKYRMTEDEESIQRELENKHKSQKSTQKTIMTEELLKLMPKIEYRPAGNASYKVMCILEERMLKIEVENKKRINKRIIVLPPGFLKRELKIYFTDPSLPKEMQMTTGTINATIVKLKGYILSEKIVGWPVHPNTRLITKGPKYDAFWEKYEKPKFTSSDPS